VYTRFALVGTDLIREPELAPHEVQYVSRSDCSARSGAVRQDTLFQNLFHALQVFFRVDANGVEVGGGDVEGEVVFEQAKLFEAFGALEGAGGERGEAVESVAAVGVEADVLPILRVCVIAVVRDGCAREVEGAAVGCGDDLHGVWVGDVLWRAADLERGDVDVWVGEGGEQGGEVLGLEERLVALDVDVDFGGDGLGYGVDAVGAAGEVGRGELDGPVILAAELRDLFGVGGDEDLVELRAGFGGGIDPGQHGAACDLAQNLSCEAGRGQAGGDDAEDADCFFGGHRMLTARAARSATVASEMRDWIIMRSLAQRERTGESVGEKAVLVLKARKR